MCPLCGVRKARRACPALNQQICPVCCGTKRLIEIPCPSDCSYLAVAKDHPPAAQVRRQQLDVSLLLSSVRDLNERQTQLFLLTTSFLVGYRPSGLHTVNDEDVAEAMRSMASTFETAARGVIYEHRSASAPAAELVAGLRPLLEKAGGNAGTAFERDAAVVLRRIESGVEVAHKSQPDNARAFLELLTRVMRQDGRPEQQATPEEAPRLIVP